MQSANGIYSKYDRKQIQVEVSQLIEEVDRIASAVANALVGRLSDADGLSRSLTEEQHVQAGEIDTRR